jgi:2-polyprenyl-3-methyl-5-hydroxy-6-metoxy-1,4-benzoquinol methylase
MEYTDKHLQNHELNFWLYSYIPPFFHKNFYEEFFDFQKLKNKKVVDIGCGGAPISDYCGVDNINLTIVDPLINDLISSTKYKHLKNYDYFSGSLFDFKGNDYQFLICLNVIDHFNDPEYNVIDKFYEILSKDSELWLYYDLRTKNDGEHLMIDENKIIEKIESKFKIIKIDDKINPKHENWSSVYKSVRLIALKK